tara:strand:- start:23 stop:406 length:384 start_codon:yes stop_codon:yes gene_type:complete
MKCPCCGYVNGTSFNPSKRILELKRLRSKHTKKLIRRTVNLIQTNIASDNELIKEYYFWQTISKIPDKVVDWSINRYLESKQPLFDGKGFKYLAQIILNHNKNRTTISKNELLRRGKPPSVVTIEED